MHTNRLRNPAIWAAIQIAAGLGLATLLAGAAAAEPQHAIAMHGEPALAAGFTHFPHSNPSAPQGGRLSLGAQGTFDNLNPFIVKGTSAQGVREYARAGRAVLALWPDRRQR
jgi:peptide/nickel transport system substrate-binding protein